MDPQQRVFLEICWECLERGGYAPDQAPGPVGVFAGMYNATYFQRHVAHAARPGRDGRRVPGDAGQREGLHRHPRRAQAQPHRPGGQRAHRLLDLAGGGRPGLPRAAHRPVPHGAGRRRLGHLPAAQRLPLPGRRDAVARRPHAQLRRQGARARSSATARRWCCSSACPMRSPTATPSTRVLRGAAVNNDGGAKASFTAPSVDGQAAVIAAALAQAGVRRAQHLLRRGARHRDADGRPDRGRRPDARLCARTPADTGFCRIGSVKSNVGHMVTAAGAAGLIKTALALHSEAIPATPALRGAEPGDRLRRARPSASTASCAPGRARPRRGAPASAPSASAAPTRTSSRRGAAARALRRRRRPAAAACCRRARRPRSQRRGRSWPTTSTRTASSAWPTSPTRCASAARPFAQRACVVAESIDEAVAALRTADSPARAGARRAGAGCRSRSSCSPARARSTPAWAARCMPREPVFRAAFDECLAALRRRAGLRPARAHVLATTPRRCAPTSVTQPATFALEYALARQLDGAGRDSRPR